LAEAARAAPAGLPACGFARRFARLPADHCVERLEAAGQRGADPAHPAPSMRDDRAALFPPLDDHAAPPGVVLASLPERGALSPVRALESRVAPGAARLPAAVRAGLRPERARLELVVRL